jgi:mannose-1-phosphate guanylyltransferase/mannose-6-phosphate isomerase
MAGGGGTRLWPASTPERPKHLFDPLLGGKSLLRRTVERLEGFVDPDGVWVVTTREQHDQVVAALPEVRADQVIAEPFGRNTAPCIALGVRRLAADHPENTLVVLPADHHVRDEEAFRTRLAAAAAHAEAAQCIVTLGIEPDHAATGFGWIERETEALPEVAGDGGVPAYAVRGFVEKPDQTRAREFLASGRHLWNAGIFVMPLVRIATELARHCASTWEALATLPLEEAYANIRAEPIDTAVMEKQTDLRVVPADVGWTDLGSWRAVLAISARDEHGNAATVADAPPPVLIDCEHTLAWSDGVQVAVVGGRELAVICIDNRVLVCPLDRAQDVRQVVEAIRQRQEKP